MRVLQVVSSDDRRGAETFARQLGESLRARDLDVTEVALDASGAADPQPFTILGPGPAHPRTLAALVRVTRAHDVVIAHGGTTLHPVAIVAGLARRPFVYRNIGDPEFWGRIRGADLRVGRPLRRASVVMALYPAAAEYLQRRYRLRPDRVVLSANAVDTKAFPRRTAADRSAARSAYGFSEGEQVVGYLGSLSPEKDPLAAVEALAGRSGTRLAVAGAGPLESDVRARAERLGVELTLLGQIADPRGFLDAIDLLVIPSRTEGVPGSLLEAAAVGVPVVATDVGGVGETLLGLGAGVAVSAGDDAGFAAAIGELLERPEVGVVSFDAVVERHDVDAIARQWAEVLTGLG